MVTVRQIERHWNQKAYDRVFQDLVCARPEGLYRPERQAATATLAAAMAVIRLDELSQTHVPLYGKLVRALLAAQEPDGGWGDPAVAALCVRALQCSRGEGLAIARGLHYLADLQKPDGSWPNVPLRRMPGDAHSSAFILAQLGDNADFRQAVRLADALAWLRTHAEELDEPTSQLWHRARLRCRPGQLQAPLRIFQRGDAGKTTEQFAFPMSATKTN
jgi:hypothetical protein